MKVEFNIDSVLGNDCVLHLSISGTKESIEEKLREVLRELDNGYGKPVQGIHINSLSHSHIITPIWEGKYY